MFYDEFVKLCSEKNVSRTKACTDCGISRTAWHKWENGATPNGATINKFADYFGVSVSQLLGEDSSRLVPMFESLGGLSMHTFEEKENSPGQIELTEREARIMAAIREMSPERQKALADLLGIADDQQ